MKAFTFDVGMNEQIWRKNRKTGAKVVAENDEFLGWVTYCVTHNGYAEHRNKTTAISWLASPQTWCEKCGEIA